MASELPDEHVDELALPEECCQKCRFALYDPDSVYWYCHRYPPSLALDECLIDLLSWPAIEMSEDNPSMNWCGEFQPKKIPGDDVPLSSIGLSNRATNALRRNNVYTVGSLCRFTADEFLDELDGVGCSVLNEVRKKLEKIGKALKGD
jgi:hypothetical protein